MQRRYLSKLYSDAVVVIACVLSSVGSSARFREFLFESKFFSLLQKNPLNVVFAMIIVALGLLAILTTPIFPLLILCAVALFISFDRKAAAKFMMMGGLSTALGALTIIGSPVSPIASMRLDGSQFTASFFATLYPYTIFGIAAIGLLSLGLKLELTPGQRETLTALVNLHRQGSLATKSKEIAELTNRHPGTIRNQMQSLRSLSLVESANGPRGGYRATEAAFKALGLDNGGNGGEIAIPVIRNGVAVEGASAGEIILNKVMRPTDQCNGLIRIVGNIRNFNVGDEIDVGPISDNNLYIHGKLMGRDDILNRLILNVTEIVSIPRISISKIARRAVRISPDASIREASRILINNGVREALVEANSGGLISVLDIASAVAKGKTDLKARDIMTHGFLTIGSDEFIFEAIKIMSKTSANQLVVMNKGMPWGFITSGDLIKFLTPANLGSAMLS
jgi:predicted transcriptional regulator